MQVLRNLGFAARFVSGYLIQLVGDVKPLEGPEGPTADFTDLHAWAEVYLPGAGWVGLDATSGLFCGEGHIPLAASPDPISAAPITGLMEKAEVTFGFEMSVRRIRETPRTTKPYTEPQWQAILARGAEVDRALTRGDMRLTMGGEPTFIAANDMDAPEWNTDALGPTKRAYAAPADPPAEGPLDRRRRAAISAWASSIPVSSFPAGRCTATGAQTGSRSGTMPHCSPRTTTMTMPPRMKPPPSPACWRSGCRSTRAWSSRRMRTSTTTCGRSIACRPTCWPRTPSCATRWSATGWPACSARAWHAVVGSVLPLRRVIDGGTRRWQSGKWFFRAGEMFLIPGDSPMGLRLPLEALPWVDPDQAEYDVEPDPFAPRTPLPPRQAFQTRRALREGPGSSIEAFRPVPQALPVIGQGDPGVVRTALAVESRDGILHVFFPPLFATEDWLALTAAVEETAAEIGRKVVLEGYLPPEDERRPALLGDPRPRRDRGQRPPRHQLGGSGPHRPRSCTRKPARSGWRRRSSTSTAAMSAPAAATTW